MNRKNLKAIYWKGNGSKRDIFAKKTPVNKFLKSVLARKDKP